MLKHVGNHNRKKVVIVFRTVPGNEHMSLLLYTETLPTPYHDTVMKVLESASGQQAKEFGDALFRALLPDGRQALNTFHVEGLLKRVPSNQVFVTPTSNATIRLDELNALLEKMEAGSDATEKLNKLDQARGIKGAHPNNTKSMSSKTTSADINSESLLENYSNMSPSDEHVLSDSELANNLKNQSAKLKASAASMLAEAENLDQQAIELVPVAKVKKSPAKTATKATAKKSRLAKNA